ncbi:MAG: thioredoxin domain-containing protein [Chloroflexota bacterium]|nr:thioredoxin domain-containing protein [Chloroflexota bacterium]
MATGKVKHVFLQHPLESIHPQAPQAAEAALCAAKQGAEAFWAMHERLFETAKDWSGQEDLTERFREYAIELGLDADAFVACLESGETAAQVQAELERGEALGVSGVPAFFINDWFISGAQPFEKFEEVIEAALQGEHPAPTPTPLPPGVTLFDPNPERPGYAYGGDAFCGSEEAEIALVEFVDFQSPENRQYLLEEWPELEKKYVEPGKVRLIVKHFPALDHTQGFTAAEAAECAGQQEAFCSMYDLLFQKQEEWSQADDLPVTLKGYAAELGLDADAFAACLDEGQTEDKVKQDFTIAQRNEFPPAPQFFIIMGERGGYVPRDQLQEAIEQLLAQ